MSVFPHQFHCQTGQTKSNLLKLGISPGLGTSSDYYHEQAPQRVFYRLFPSYGTGQDKQLSVCIHWYKPLGYQLLYYAEYTYAFLQLSVVRAGPSSPVSYTSFIFLVASQGSRSVAHVPICSLALSLSIHLSEVAARGLLTFGYWLRV